MHNYFREGGMRWTTRGLEQQLFQENEWFGFSRTRGSFPTLWLVGATYQQLTR
jgi:hypothetical protein